MKIYRHWLRLQKIYSFIKFACCLLGNVYVQSYILINYISGVFEKIVQSIGVDRILIGRKSKIRRVRLIEHYATTIFDIGLREVIPDKGTRWRFVFKRVRRGLGKIMGKIIWTHLNWKIVVTGGALPAEVTRASRKWGTIIEFPSYVQFFSLLKFIDEDSKCVRKTSFSIAVTSIKYLKIIYHVKY